MKSWSEWFVHRADARKREQNRPCGFDPWGGAIYMTDHGPISIPEAIRRFGRDEVMRAVPR